MKLSISTGAVATSDDFKEFTFGIKSSDMGIILEILRSKMYKNPIAAICREIAANARDANKEVGNKQPIKININEANIYEHICEASISFTDNGPGISPERMADVFVNYGASTKRENNQQIGGFGLGAKTPFAYTDNFTIITIYNEIQYHYVAAIEENNTGKIYLLNESKTTKPNGTTIVIPIKQQDIYLFQTELIRATYFWTIKPIFNFENHHDFKCIHSQYGSLLTSNSLFNHNLYALIDGVPYEVDSSKITSLNFNYTILLHFRTGTLGISANRESIRYDDETIKKIQIKYEKFIKDLQEKTQKNIDTAKNYFDAAVKLRKIVEIDNLAKVLFNNNIVPLFESKKVDFNLHLPNGLELFKIDSTKHLVDKLEEDMTDIYLIDKNKMTAGRNLTIFNSTHKPFFYYLDITNKILKTFSSQDISTKKRMAHYMRNILKKIEWFKSIGINLIPYSTIKPTRIIKEKRSITIIPAKIIRKDRYSRTMKPLMSSKVHIDSIKRETHTFKILETKMRYIGMDVLNWTQVLETYGIQVLFVSNLRSNQLKEHLFEFEKIKTELDKNKASQISNAFTASNFDKNMFDITKFDFNQQIKNSASLIKKLAKINKLETLPEEFLDSYPISQELTDAMSLVNEIQTRYPLLSKFNHHYDDNIDHFNDYISLIDTKEEYERYKMAQDARISDICLQR